MTRISCFCLCVFCAALTAVTSPAQTPEWIWQSSQGQSPTNNETCSLRKTFTIEGKVNRAVLSVAADDRAGVSVNGSPTLAVNGYERATRRDVTEFLRPGENQLTIQATNDSSVAGVLVRLELSLPNRRREVIVSDASWLASMMAAGPWRVPPP